MDEVTGASVNRYGLFNHERSAEGDAAFFAIQVAVSTYPEDPLAKKLESIEAEISSLTDHSRQSALAGNGAEALAGIVPFIEYCVWDYTIVSSVAKKEFSSWVDDLQSIAGSAEDPEDVTPFLEDDTSYFVATLAVLSAHSSLRNWLAYYPAHLQGHEFFQRKTIAAVLHRFGESHSEILPNCTNAMFITMPSGAGSYYSGKQLRSKDWEYLRPVY
jgi:hypothetical protein